MEDTLLHFLSNIKPSPLPYPKAHSFPLSHHDYCPALSCPRTLHFPTLSSKTNTASLPPKPFKTPETPSISSHHTPPPPQSQPHEPPNTEFQEKILYLDSIGLDIFSLINHDRPFILSASLSNIKSIIDLLTSMNFTPQEFRRIISMCPEILTSTPSTVTPVITFLLREARVNGSDLKHVINRRPRLLVSSVKYCLRPTLYFLQSIGLEEVKRHTYLLSCSVEKKLLPRIQYFEKIGFAYKDAVSMFRRFPQLFNYSIKNNIEPKLNYFVVEMGRDLKELKEFPQYFSFSLENRIKPRHQCCVEKGLCFPLHTLLKTSQEEFMSRIDVCCNSSVPLRSSPLYSVNCDVDSSTNTE
ncbi:protein SEEDLING LETHAL 1, chloroplastic-like [Populus alba]|uniref:Mitochondrial transcription termination factor family protein n=1 Tax=Populus tomentosa TaxID=118781 RepID=A0A1L6K5M6_POPTO|nr:transcription termination factor MTEF1, chloroplastic-like [Populus alba]APR64135.1 hypothetical protein [Populus tomentosa]